MQDVQPLIEAPGVTVVRCEARVKGTVQGVGFRPFVYRLATSLGLAGSVSNTPRGVVIEVEGGAETVSAFLERLVSSAPPLSRITGVETSELAPAGLRGFRIVESAAGPQPTALTPPDVALCADCAREIADPRDRRFAYAFTNCTNCGPRFSIVRGIPYDRRQTTMASFAMCPDCEAEYHDPADRRFHAEPVACPACGPALFVGGAPAPDAIARVARWLSEGMIVALKGLGGYHLACDARNAEAVEALRVRKGRGQKPFAIMVRDLGEAARVADLPAAAAELLASPESPIVILPARPGNALAPSIAPRQRTVGVILPYTPLHRLLLEKAPPALVMTSGNLAEEPIEHRDQEACRKLGPISDHILSHNREIAVPCDDSVVRCAAGLVIPFRRARGFVPRPVAVEVAGPPVLAVGGHHKSTFCLLRGGEAILSQHIGDLDSAEVLGYFGEAVQHFAGLFEVEPEVIAHDLHPGYLSTEYAKSHEQAPFNFAQGRPGRPRLIGVQHHHAHVAAVMAELGLAGPVIGVAYDGSGYGPDGTVWGGEILIADLREFRRAAHLRSVPMPGGEAAVRRPARMALSYLLATFGEQGIGKARRLMPALAESEVRVVARQIERGLNSPLTSSLGRLFDAVSALLGGTPDVTFEGQPAMELEAMADDWPGRPMPYPYEIEDDVIDPRPMLAALVADLERGASPAEAAARFHETVAAWTIEACRALHAAGGPKEVVLCGGVMQNARLASLLLAGLSDAGLRPHLPEQVPPNDGGLSLGQAVIAATRAEGAEGTS